MADPKAKVIIEADGSDVAREAAQVSKALEKLDKGIGKAFSKGIKESGSLLEDMAHRAGQAFGALTNPVVLATTAVAGLGTAAVVTGKKAMDAAADFQSAMANVGTLVDTAAVDMEGLSNQVLSLSGQLGAPARELADGLYQVLSAGVPAGDAMRVLEASVVAAKAGLTDTTTAVDVLTTVLNSYGMSADQVTAVSDKMFQAVVAGKTTFPELAQSIGQVAGIAATAGVTFDELMAATASLTAAGLQTPSAMEGLRSAIANIIKPSEQAKNMANLLGIEFDGAALKSQGLSGMMDQIKGAVDRLKDPETIDALIEKIQSADSQFVQITDSGVKLTSQGEKMRDMLLKMKEQGVDTSTILAQLFGDVTGLNVVMNLTGPAADSFQKNLNDMAAASGKTDEAFQKQNETFNRTRERVGVLAENVLIKIGNVFLPVLEKALNWVVRNWPTIEKVFTVTGQVIKFVVDTYILAPIRLAIGIFETLVSTAQWVLDKVTSIASSVSNFLSRIFSDRDKARGAAAEVQALGVSGAEGMSVPGFAHGGIVTSRTLAFVGEAGTEAIVPQSNAAAWLPLIARWAGAGAGGGVVIGSLQVVVQASPGADPRGFGQVVGDALFERLSRMVKL